MAIIRSLLDQDVYKFYMAQVVFHKFKDKEVEYTFKCRNKRINNTNFTVIRLAEEIMQYQRLKFEPRDIAYLKTLGVFKDDFLNFLANEYSNDKGRIIINGTDTKWHGGITSFHIKEGEELEIKIKGKWIDTIFYEVPVLAMVNEIFFDNPETKAGERRVGLEKLRADTYYIKDNIPNVKFAEFGTRRRYSFFWQNEVIRWYVKNLPNNMVGTSNVYFAREYGIKPVGTMAHEYIMAGQALAPDICNGQIFMLTEWKKEYGDKLDTALTDTLGTDAFCEDMKNFFWVHGDNYDGPGGLDSNKAKEMGFKPMFTGFRQDSGTPQDWICRIGRMLNQVNYFGNVTLVFSDSLDFKKCRDIVDFMEEVTSPSPNSIFYVYDPTRNSVKNEYQRCFAADKVNVLFGIGTHLTNNLIREPLNIVIKMTKCDGQPVVKISDSETKGSVWDGKEKDLYEEYAKYLKSVLVNKT